MTSEFVNRLKVCRAERTLPLVAIVHSTCTLPDSPGFLSSSRS